MTVDEVMVRWADDYVAQYGCEVEFSTSKIKTEVMNRGKKEGKNISRGSIMPSDHCYNRANDDPVSFKSNTPLFIYIKRDCYQCVGSKYNYDGLIFCDPNDVNQELVWGYFDNKTRKKVHSPGSILGNSNPDR